MDANIVGYMVNHLNLHSVAFPSNNSRAWKLPIHCHNALRMAQSRHILQLDLSNTKCNMPIHFIILHQDHEKKNYYY